MVKSSSWPENLSNVGNARVDTVSDYTECAHTSIFNNSCYWLFSGKKDYFSLRSLICCTWMIFTNLFTLICTSKVEVCQPKKNKMGTKSQRHSVQHSPTTDPSSTTFTVNRRECSPAITCLSSFALTSLQHKLSPCLIRYYHFFVQIWLWIILLWKSD